MGVVGTTSSKATSGGTVTDMRGGNGPAVGKQKYRSMRFV